MKPILRFTPYPILSTERLTLRQLKSSDDDEIFILRSDSRVLQFIDIPVAKNTGDAREFIRKINKGIAENESILWGITLNENVQKIIGTICLWNVSIEENKAEIGYVLHPDFQGKGIMQEAVKAVISYGFNDMQLDKIEAGIHPENIKSIRLLEKYDFVYEKKEEELVVYSLLKSTAVL